MCNHVIFISKFIMHSFSACCSNLCRKHCKIFLKFLVAGGIGEKVLHGTNSEDVCQCYFPLNHQKANRGPSNIDGCGFASGIGLVTKKNATHQCSNIDTNVGAADDQQGIESQKQFLVEIETNDIYCLIEKSGKNCLQCHSSVSDCDAEEVCGQKRIKKQRKTRLRAKVEQKRRKHDYDYDEEALRRRLSLISIDSLDCETQTNLMKKENGYIPVSDNVYDSKTEAIMKKSRRSSNDLHESLNRNNAVTEDTQAVNVDEIKGNETKHDTIRAYSAQQGRHLIKLPADIGLEPERVRLATEADEALSNASIELEPSTKNSKKMERKINRVSEDSHPCVDLPSRVIVVKNPKIKSRKKHKSKTVANVKKSEKQKEDQEQAVSRSDEQVSRYKEAKRERKEKSSKSKQQLRKSDAMKSSSQYSSAKDANQQRRSQKDKRKKKENSSEEDNCVMNKTKPQQSVSNYEIKSSSKVAQGFSYYNSEQNVDQAKRRSSQETAAKIFTKRASEKELWFSIPSQTKATAEPSRQSRSSRAPKQNDRTKTAVDDDDDQKASTKKIKAHGLFRRALASKEKSNKDVRAADAKNLHIGVSVYDVSNAIRPELRGWKGNDPDKKSYGISPPKHLTKLSSSSDNDSKSYSSESSTSHEGVSSSESGNSAYRSDLENSPNARYQYMDKQNKFNSSSIEINNKRDVTVTNAVFNKHRNRPQRSASSTSSFQRYPCHIVDEKAKPRYKQANSDKTGYKKYAHKTVNLGNKAEDDESPPSSSENIFEPSLGKRRNKRPNVSVVAEGEDGHSPWQHQQLVVVSQKPGAFTTRKTGVLKSQQQSKQTSGSFVKNVSSGSDKRPQTIRDLYSLHNVLSDTQNGTVSFCFLFSNVI